MHLLCLLAQFTGLPLVLDEEVLPEHVPFHTTPKQGKLTGIVLE